MRLLIGVVGMFVLWLASVTVALAMFQEGDLPDSAVMEIDRAKGARVRRTFVPLEQVSPWLVKSVIASEDGRFCTHWGIDPREVVAAIRRARNGRPRGASTITMQVAKNLFLWPDQSYVRKALEVPATILIEIMWSKQRILEVYLNIAQWGSGIFGAEAASLHHFGKPARRLTLNEAARLAVSLPAPQRRRAGRPTSWLNRLAGRIEARVRSNPGAAFCALASP
ncbi:MAG: monofunctional biosynthetic peptidoglycan transglycosylase [Hyphomicrobiaceae bacterium]|nr:monofunctional biosynthetic peptidoglycan transglycosylase [Hyphomicrobiaceae bacterium]